MVGRKAFPDIRLVEFEAARQVAGSKLGLGVGKDSYLIDCGSSYSEDDVKKLPFNARNIDSLILTHAHADHMGQVPELYKEGFRGPVYSTQATAEICEHQIGQALSFAEFEARKKRREKEGGRGRSNGDEIEPANRYEGISLEEIMDLFVRDEDSQRMGLRYGQKVEAGDGLELSFYEAGHIPGAAQILHEIEAGGKKRKLLTAFDMGRTDYVVSEFPVTDTPFVRFPHSDFEHDIDYIVAEATYGARTHRPIDESISLLEDCFNKAYKNNSKLIIPAFSIMRTQMLLYYLFRLDEQGRLPGMPIYFSSPSAEEVNKIMLRHYAEFDEQAIEAFKDRHYNPFHFGKLEYISSAADNRELLYDDGRMAIIAASGMCDFGRVVGHLERAIGNPRNIVLLTGYQNPGTRGWKIEQKVNNPSSKPLIEFPYGDKRLEAQVYRMHGMSGHADGREMTAHIKKIMPPNNPPREIFIKHGDPEQCEGLKQLLVNEGYKPKAITIMEKGKGYSLD